MTVKTFYNSELALTVVAGCFSVTAMPIAHAAPLAKAIGFNNDQASAIPSVRTMDLPRKALFMTPPPQLPEAGKNPSVGDVLGRAFNKDDLSNLYGAGGFATCETSSRVPSFFEKNYSNFAATCLEDFRSRQAISFDERFQANPQTQGIAVSPLGGRMQWTSISTGARERLLQRSINDLAQRNKTVADIIQGRISFDFGLGELISGGDSSAAKVEPARPRYVVEVIDPTPVKQGKNRPLFASLGRLPAGSMQKEGAWFTQKPIRSKRTLKEIFDPASASAAGEESIVPESAKTASQKTDIQESISSIRYMARQAGLNSLPFTKVNMRAERRMIEGKNVFALRATESQDLFFAEVPDIRNSHASSMVWGYKIPWKQHTLAVRMDEGAQEKVTTYSYKLDDSNKSELNYNHKTNAVSAGFAISF